LRVSGRTGGSVAVGPMPCGQTSHQPGPDATTHGAREGMRVATPSGVSHPRRLLSNACEDAIEPRLEYGAFQMTFRHTGERKPRVVAIRG